MIQIKFTSVVFTFLLSPVSSAKQGACAKERSILNMRHEGFRTSNLPRSISSSSLENPRKSSRWNTTARHRFTRRNYHWLSHRGTGKNNSAPSSTSSSLIQTFLFFVFPDQRHSAPTLMALLSWILRWCKMKFLFYLSTRTLLGNDRWMASIGID